MRAFEPDEPNLASRFISEVAYAAYQQKNGPHFDRWIAVHESEAISSYLRWPHLNRPAGIVATPVPAGELRSTDGVAVIICCTG